RSGVTRRSRPPALVSGAAARTRIGIAATCAARLWITPQRKISIRVRPASAEMQRELLGEMRDDLAEVAYALVGQARRGTGNRDRAERLGMLVVDRRSNAAGRARVLLVVEGIASLADHAQGCPHRLHRHDRVFGDARQA